MTPSRDKHEDSEYFEESLNYSVIQEVRFWEKLAAKNLSDDQRYQFSNRLFHHTFTIFQASYALNRPRSALTAIACDLAKVVIAKAMFARSIGGKGAFPIGSKPTPFLEGYIDALRVLALGILYNVPQPDFVELCEAVDHRGEDALLDRFAAYGMLVEPSEPKLEATLIYPSVFQPLYTAFFLPTAEIRLSFVQRYMNTYYHNMRPCPWHDRHLRKGAGYNGYWAWEAAAVVKLLGLDDASLRHMDYYPDDL